jgi:hypothetical protein
MSRAFEVREFLHEEWMFTLALVVRRVIGTA